MNMFLVVWIIKGIVIQCSVIIIWAVKIKPWLLRVLPNYVGIIINHCKDPYETTNISWKATFFLWLICCKDLYKVIASASLLTNEFVERWPTRSRSFIMRRWNLTMEAPGFLDGRWPVDDSEIRRFTQLRLVGCGSHYEVSTTSKRWLALGFLVAINRMTHFCWKKSFQHLDRSTRKKQYRTLVLSE